MTLLSAATFMLSVTPSKFLRDKFPDTKIVGGNWGVGHPKLPGEGQGLASGGRR